MGVARKARVGLKVMVVVVGEVRRAETRRWVWTVMKDMVGCRAYKSTRRNIRRGSALVLLGTEGVGIGVWELGQEGGEGASCSIIERDCRMRTPKEHELLKQFLKIEPQVSFAFVCTYPSSRPLRRCCLPMVAARLPSARTLHRNCAPASRMLRGLLVLALVNMWLPVGACGHRGKVFDRGVRNDGALKQLS